MHPLTASAGAAGLQPDIVQSVEGIGLRLDVELQGIDALDLEQTRDLARRVAAACSGVGNGSVALAWRNGVQARLKAREDLLKGSEDSMINLDTTRYFAAVGTGTRAVERARVPRSRWGLR